MPFPSELTTPPVMKTYFVELTDSPPATGELSPLQPTPSRPAYRSLAPPDRRTARHRWESRAARAGAARVSPTALLRPVVTAPNAPMLRVCTRTRPRVGGRRRRLCLRGRTESALARSRANARVHPPRLLPGSDPRLAPDRVSPRPCRADRLDR